MIFSGDINSFSFFKLSNFLKFLTNTVSKVKELCLEICPSSGCCSKSTAYLTIPYQKLWSEDHYSLN